MIEPYSGKLFTSITNPARIKAKEDQYKYTRGHGQVKKDEFLGLSLDDQVSFINEQLAQGISFNQVVRDLNVPKTTLFNRINKFYRKEGNAYIAIEALNNYKDAPLAYSNGAGIAGDRLAMMSQAGALKEILSSVKRIESDFADIMHRQATVEDSAGNTDPYEQKVLKVELPGASISYVSVQVNREVFSRWSAFVRSMHGYSSSDLVSMAFKEFMDKYGQ